MIKMRTTNEKTGEHFDIEDSCIFVRQDMIAKGIKKRKWKKSDCFTHRVR